MRPVETRPALETEPYMERELMAAKILRVIDACGMRRHASSPASRYNVQEEIWVSKQYLDRLGQGQFEFGGKQGSDIAVSLDDMRREGFITREEDTGVYMDIQALVVAWETLKQKHEPASLFAR